MRGSIFLASGIGSWHQAMDIGTPGSRSPCSIRAMQICRHLRHGLSVAELALVVSIVSVITAGIVFGGIQIHRGYEERDVISLLRTVAGEARRLASLGGMSPQRHLLTTSIALALPEIRRGQWAGLPHVSFIVLQRRTENRMHVQAGGNQPMNAIQPGSPHELMGMYDRKGFAFALVGLPEYMCTRLAGEAGALGFDTAFIIEASERSTIAGGHHLTLNTAIPATEMPNRLFGGHPTAGGSPLAEIAVRLPDACERLVNPILYLGFHAG